MIGLGQIRAYRTLAKKPRHLPRHSDDDVRLFRIIAWGAFVYFVVALVAYLVVTNFVFEIEHDLVFTFVLPVTFVLLVCWWTTDMVPRFARWSVIWLTVIASFLSIAVIVLLPTWNKIEAAGILIYFGLVTKEAVVQLRAIREAAASEVEVEDKVT